MGEAIDTAGEVAGSKGKSKLLLGAAVFALLAGGGGFYAVFSGVLVLPFLDQQNAKPDAYAAGESGDGEEYADAPNQFVPGVYVKLDPLIISLGDQSFSSHLRVDLTVEVKSGREADIEAIKPRIIDVLNIFLRAVDEREFELPRSMERLRMQMLRRVRLVAPEGAIRDLLIQEFVLN